MINKEDTNSTVGPSVLLNHEVSLEQRSVLHISTTGASGVRYKQGSKQMSLHLIN